MNLDAAQTEGPDRYGRVRRGVHTGASLAGDGCEEASKRPDALPSLSTKLSRPWRFSDHPSHQWVGTLFAPVTI